MNRKLAVSILVVSTVARGMLGFAATEKETTLLQSETFKGLELRSIGPAFMSGRIADIAVDQEDSSTWYVAVGSGGVWKTTNAGTTWSPVFDKESAYSIGCVVIDPHDRNTIWVGTGEDVGGRHVGFGNGVYRSRDGGQSWQNMGLQDSQHISRILIDPRDPKVVYVAAQGPLWSAGGDRGLYKSSDGGESWTKVLGGGEWTGVTDVVMDPRDPDRLCAATWQHHRTVAAVMDGGPESGIHISRDGGATWSRVEEGLPQQHMGKIGLAISPQKPDILYAVIELAQRSGGFFRSSNGGESWEKRSDTVSGGTGPHYYQELMACPHAFDRVYLMDVRMQVTEDGGTSFDRVNEKNKHSDNHALAFRADDPQWLLAGTDGGLYESFDRARSWRFVANLPVTQFYKVAVDDDLPFYSIYGGTQDNSTQGGPSRTDTWNGIRNADWLVTLFADGHQPATEPGNPDIVYCEWQQGNLVRYDRTTGEIVYLQPQPEPGDPPERFNWDAPILVSPHDPKRIYYASQRVWRSDDRGDAWRAVSPDLTRNQDRLLLPLMGRQWSYDEAWDLIAMSNYNTITSLAESPVREGLLYAGTDDGLIQVSEDGGESWRKVEVGDLPGVPEAAFVNDLKADLFDEDTVYAALDNHKYGDFNPYLLKSTDRGRSWRSIAANLPERHLVWRLVQDHERPELLFAATEFGVFCTVDGGGRWFELTGGVPTISFRDLAIQRRENDLVAASFGRGFFILDDYSPLRRVDEAALAQDALLFAPRDAWWYVPKTPLGGRGKASQGDAHFLAPNPDFGAVVTYYLKEGFSSAEEERQKREKELLKEGKDTPYPGWQALTEEAREDKPVVVLTVRDGDGNPVRRLEGPAGKGFHRVAWDLRLAPQTAVGTVRDEWEAERGEQGFLVAPGSYSVDMAVRVRGQLKPLAEALPFNVVQMREGALPAASADERAAFMERVGKLQRAVTGSVLALGHGTTRIEQMAQAARRLPQGTDAFLDQLQVLQRELAEAETKLVGTSVEEKMGQPTVPSISRRLQVVLSGNMFSTSGPTATHRRSLEIACEQYESLQQELHEILDVRLEALGADLEAAGAPYSVGREVPRFGEDVP